MRRLRRLLPLVLAAAWTALLGLGLLLPGRAFPAPPAGAATVVHVVLFAGLVGLWVRALPRAAVVVVVAAVFVAVGSEGFQAEIVPGRGLETRDLWANLAGIGLGWALAALWRRHRRRSYGRPRPARTRPRTAEASPRRDVGSSVRA